MSSLFFVVISAKHIFIMHWEHEVAIIWANKKRSFALKPGELILHPSPE